MIRKFGGYKVPVLVVFISAIALSVYMFFAIGWWRFNYPSKAAYPVRGIDISHHQKAINWSKVKQEDISFIYIKATEGERHKDTLFAGHVLGAKSNGLRVGAYHYFLFCKSPFEQARNFIETVPVQLCDLPPAIDLEFGGFCKESPNAADIVPQIKIFIDILTQHYKQAPVIYTTRKFYRKYLREHFAGNPLWLRSIVGEPELGKRNWTIWQYTDKGKIEGIQGNVDLNVFNGDSLSF